MTTTDPTHAPPVPADSQDAPTPLSVARQISPRRKTSVASDIPGLAEEQLRHFGIDPTSEYGQHLGELCQRLYHANVDLASVWHTGVRELADLPRDERINRFAAQKFLCFQLAKLLDTLQHPFRKTYQSIVDTPGDRSRKGPYPIFDNVTALFSAKPVITRTATYIYACAEWVEDAFQGREMLHEIYSRLLNPTSIALANHIVDIECGPDADKYMAWNFNSGMAAVDAILSHLVGYQDIILSSRNVYGGTYQLMHDWFAKPGNLDVSVNFFDGDDVAAFTAAFDAVMEANADRIAQGRQLYVYLESPCNPHGYAMDVPGICRAAHERGLTVICDSTVGTPFLHRPLLRPDAMERPDFVIHSYTKDISGTGSTTAGVVIGPNHRMFMGKHDQATAADPDGSERVHVWDETLFWNVYYVKGAFLDADKASEVLNGMATLEARMLQKVVNTHTLAEALSHHPQINVNCSACDDHPNAKIRNDTLFCGFAPPLFTFDFEGDGSHSANDEHAYGQFDRVTFERFFDALDPVFGHQVSLGTPNTLVLCPAITSHSELSRAALREAGIAPTTTRVSVGQEDARSLLAHLIGAAKATLDPEAPGFSDGFPSPDTIDAIYRKHYIRVHQAYLDAQPSMHELMM